MTTTTTTLQSNTESGSRKIELLASLDGMNVKPLWAQMKRVNPPFPNPAAIPFVWRYDVLRPQLMQAGELISEKEAERRVLMLINPKKGAQLTARPMGVSH